MTQKIQDSTTSNYTACYFWIWRQFIHGGEKNGAAVSVTSLGRSSDERHFKSQFCLFTTRSISTANMGEGSLGLSCIPRAGWLSHALVFLWTFQAFPSWLSDSLKGHLHPTQSFLVRMLSLLYKVILYFSLSAQLASKLPAAVGSQSNLFLMLGSLHDTRVYKNSHCISLDARGVWGRMDTCIRMAESLCSPPETITTLTLLISYSMQKKKKLKKNPNEETSILVP